jgi:hypothetical protein
MPDTTLARIATLAFLCLSIWLAAGVGTYGQGGAGGGDLTDPVETVMLLIETPHYDGPAAASRRAALVEILLRQPGVRRIVAYAVGMGDQLELWSEVVPPPIVERDGAAKRETERREVLTRALEMFIRETASNRSYSMSRIVDGMRSMMKSHADWVDRRFQNSSGVLPDEMYHMRMLTATQDFDPAFRSRVPATNCQRDGDLESWPRGILVPRTFTHYQTRRDQVITVFSIYDANAAGNHKLNSNIEAFLHASLKRDGLIYGGVYYLDEPTLEPEPPRSQPNDETHVCDVLIRPTAPEDYKPRGSVDRQHASAKSVAPPSAAGSPLRPSVPVPAPSPGANVAVPPAAELRLPPAASNSDLPSTMPPAGPSADTTLPRPAPPASAIHIPETLQQDVPAGQTITRRLTDLFGRDASAITILRPRMKESTPPPHPGAGTLSGEVFRYLADRDGRGEHKFDIDFVDETGATRHLALIVRVTPPANPARPAPPPGAAPPLRPNELSVSVFWAGAGVDLDVQIFTPDPRRTPADKLVPPGNVTRDHPGTARFLARRVESGSMVEQIIFDRVPRGSYVAAVSIRAASPTGCQRRAIRVTYKIDQSGPTSYKRGGFQVGAAGSVPIPIACDSAGRLLGPVFAPLVEVSTP